MINVGIDVGKCFCQAALKAEDGRLLDELRFENTSQGIQELIMRITVHGEARAVLESPGNYWILVQAAQHARQHDLRFRAYYERVAKRRGPQKAIVAVAKEMLVVIWFMLSRHEPYRDQNLPRVETKLKHMNTLAKSGLQAA